MNGPNKLSTERVQRFRQRHLDAGNTRITLYLDRESQCKLDQLSANKGQARYLETLVKAAIKREWTALASRRNDGEHPQRSDDGRAVFLGRRRNLAEG